MEIVFSDCNLGVRGENFRYIFSYKEAGLESLCKDGNEWLFRAPKPTFWRASTDNDKGSSFPYKSAEWMGADLFIKCVNIEVEVDSNKLSFADITAPNNNNLVNSSLRAASEMKITYTYKTATHIPATVLISYSVDGSGKIKTDFVYQGVKGLPDLPTLGLRFIFPFSVSGYIYEGLSGETYPDRMKGGKKGVFEIKGMPITPYLVPQECQNHMDTKNLTILYGDKKLNIEMDTSPFPFTLLPNTALELESAYHQEELPNSGRSVLSIYAKVRGVGGINSWGADVREKYHIPSDKDYSMSLHIS